MPLYLVAKQRRFSVIHRKSHNVLTTGPVYYILMTLQQMDEQTAQIPLQQNEWLFALLSF